MLHHRSGLPLFCAAVFAALALSATGCIFSPEDDDDDPPVQPPLRVSRSQPDSLLVGLQRIYNAKEYSMIERLSAYDSLFLRNSDDPPRQGFLFEFQPADVPETGPSWGIDPELEAHRGLFTAQDNGDVYLLELRMTYGAVDSLEVDAPETGWDTIFVSNVYLRLMFNPNDGLEVNGGQAEFTFAPDLYSARTRPAPPNHNPYFQSYWIAKWKDLPRP